MKKFIDLTFNEKKDLIRKNKNLYNELYDITSNGANLMINDYLDTFKPGAVELRPHYYHYFTIVKNYDLFVKGCNKLNEFYGCLNSYETELKKANSLLEKFMYYDLSFDNQLRVEKRLNELCETLNDKLTNIINNEIDSACDIDVMADSLDILINDYYNCDELMIDDDLNIVKHVPEQIIQAHYETIF